MFNVKDYKKYESTAVVRYAELSLLAHILSENKICILCGSAGIGKTHLVMTYIRNCSNSIYFKCPALGNIDYEMPMDDCNQNSVIAIDDIENIADFLESSYFEKLKNIEVQNIILITRPKVMGIDYNVIKIAGFTKNQSYDYIKKIARRSYSEYEIEQIVRISNGSPTMLQIMCTLPEEYSNFEEIWELLALRENKELLFEFLHEENDDVFASLDDSEYQTLLEIILFGKIDASLLIRWDPRPDEYVLQSIESLVCKDTISRGPGDVLYGDYVVEDLFEEYPLCYDYYVDIMDSIKHDLLSGIVIDEKYILSIIAALKNHFEFVDFIVVYYENKMQVVKKEEFNQTLTQIIQQVTNIHNILDKDVVPQVSRLSHIEESVDILVKTQRESINLINRLADGFVNDQEALNQLDELMELVKNPKKSKWERVNSCIGFLGSVATLATFSEDGFTQNINTLTQGASSILSQLLPLLERLPFIK